MASKIIHVAVAAIEDGEGRFLVSKRHHHLHQGGLWEFPGGKLEPGESFLQALARELKEELNVSPLQSEPLIRITHHYKDRSVLLDVRRVKSFIGVPNGMEGQPLAWLHPESMQFSNFPAANRSIILALRLPERYMITGRDPTHAESFFSRLEEALSRGIRLVQLRAHQLSDPEYKTLAARALDLCRQSAAKLVLNRPNHPEQWVGFADGIHLNRHQLSFLDRRSADTGLWGASCHNPVELEKAQYLGLDYALLSPVRSTPSHSEAKPLGWERFAAWVDPINLPVYALGGMSVDSLFLAKQMGGQGIAGISGLWLDQMPNP